jgi:hypothetical protein
MVPLISKKVMSIIFISDLDVQGLFEPFILLKNT